MHKLALVRQQQTWYRSRFGQHLWGIAGACAAPAFVPTFISQFCRLAEAWSGTAQTRQQLHKALNTCSLQRLGRTELHVRAKQVGVAQQCLGTADIGTTAHIHCTGHMKAQIAAEPSSQPGQLRQLQHSSSVSDAAQGQRAPDTAAWVEQVLSSEFQDHASRGLVTNLYQNLNNMLHLIRSTASRRGRRRADLYRYQRLLASMHVQLPRAIAVLADRAAYLATSEAVPLGERMHAPVALMLYSSTLQAAPAALCRQLMHDEELGDGRRALESILARCVYNRMFYTKPKFVSMTCKSFILLHDAGIWAEVVRKFQTQFLGRMSTAIIRRLDIEAVADLCALIAAFRAAPEQRRPRAWYMAMAHLREIAAVVGAAHRCMAARPQKALKPTDIAAYLEAAAQLDLPVPEEAVTELFRSAVARRQECPPLKIVSMLAALKKLQVQLSQERDWLPIRMHVRSASLDDLAGFCRAAQEADVVVHRVVALELARAASRAAAAEGSDAAQVAAVLRHEEAISSSAHIHVEAKLDHGRWQPGHCYPSEFFRVFVRPAAQTAPESSTPIAASKDLRLVCESELQAEK